MFRRERILILLIATLTLPLLGLNSVALAVPMNVILFVGDGMGFEAVEATRMYANNNTAPLFFETLPYSGQMTHNNVGDSTTDSAASATAMATGVKVNNSTISVKQPGDLSDLPTVLEILSTSGKRTGLVTSHTSITDATPAAFGAHTTDRGNHSEIANDYLTQTRPNVLFGREQADLLADAPGAGYTTVTTLAHFNAINPNTNTHYAGLFNSTQQPTLAAMTTTALDILDNDPDGFFLLVEHEDIDSGGHDNDLSRVVNGTLQLNDAVQAAYSWATTAGVLGNTLIVVTADHETGGLNVTSSNGAGVLPNHTWSTGGHTQTPVPVFASGPAEDASRVTGTIDNTDIHYILTSTAPVNIEELGTTVSFQQGVDSYSGTVDTYLDQNTPNSNHAADTELNVDSDTAGGNQQAQALIRFEDLFGSGPGQIPLNGEILQARLELQVTNPGDAFELYRMLQPWNDTDTWNSLVGGISADGVEAASTFDTVTADIDTGLLIIDVTNTLIDWQADPATNYGWAILPTGTNGVDFFSAEGSTPPSLLVTFANPAVVPEPSGLVILLTLGLFLPGIRIRRLDKAAIKPETLPWA